jgi:hypothetical protein
MNARKQMQPRRVQRKTLLIIGEGDAEEVFLKYLKTLLVGRNSGIQIKIGNAHGKGARNVIDHARKQWASIAYDQVAVLFDTDTDWSPEVEKHARDTGILILACTPCLETELLLLAGKPGPQRTSDAKRAFHKAFNAEAHRPELYPAFFPLLLLEGHIVAKPDSLLSRLARLMTHTA